MCLSPWGESGLKSFLSWYNTTFCKSLPVRGEWIEMARMILFICFIKSLSPWGESGLKSLLQSKAFSISMSLSPWGESGLKFFASDIVYTFNYVSPREGRVDWNRCSECSMLTIRSLSPWGESGLKSIPRLNFDNAVIVSPREGRVDWNIYSKP